MGNRTPARARNNNNNNNPPLLLQPQDPYLAAMQASMAEAPLPLGWDEAVTSKGVVYYIDHVNGVTTYQDPRLTAPATLNKKKKKKKEKLPKFKRDLYSKVQRLLVKMHQIQQDDGQLQITIMRDNLLEDSFNSVSVLDSQTLTRRLFIKFEGEEGLDYGGMSREWFLSLSDKILAPELHLFRRNSTGTHYQINKYSHLNKDHLQYFRFVGTVLGMAIYHGKLFYAYFSPIFYQALLERPFDISDLQNVDEIIYKSMKKLKEAEDVSSWELDFTITDKNEDGKPVTIELKKGGSDIMVTNENKKEYIDLVLNYYFHSTDAQMAAIKEGFHQFVSLDLLKEFEPEELEQIMAGNKDIDVNDLKASTDYGDGYSENNSAIKLFWEVMMNLTQEELVHFLQFATGSTRVPVGGFSHLYGSNGPQKFTIIPKKLSGLPTAHSCFNRLELPSYTDKEKLKKDLVYAITETQGFGLE